MRHNEVDDNAKVEMDNILKRSDELRRKGSSRNVLRLIKDHSMEFMLIELIVEEVFI